MVYLWASSILIGWSFIKSWHEKFVMSKKNKTKKETVPGSKQNNNKNPTTALGSQWIPLLYCYYFLFYTKNRIEPSNLISPPLSPIHILVKPRKPSNPCVPSPCGPGTTCDVNPIGNAICHCQPGLIPKPDTITGCGPECTIDPECG